MCSSSHSWPIQTTKTKKGINKFEFLVSLHLWSGLSTKVEVVCFPSKVFKSVLLELKTPVHSSVPLEWTSSVGKDILQAKRGGLSNSNFEKLVSLKCNNGLFKAIQQLVHNFFPILISEEISNPWNIVSFYVQIITEKYILNQPIDSVTRIMDYNLLTWYISNFAIISATVTSYLR